MIFFGHIGLSAGAVHVADRVFHQKTDLRKVALVAVAADLIDKPVALAFPDFFGQHSRLFGHSLVALAIFAAVLLIRRRSIYQICVFAGVGLGHLILDRIWRYDLHALFWPFWPWPVPLDQTNIERWRLGFLLPYNVGGEVVGLIILLWLYFTSRPKATQEHTR